MNQTATKVLEARTPWGDSLGKRHSRSIEVGVVCLVLAIIISLAVYTEVLVWISWCLLLIVCLYPVFRARARLEPIDIFEPVYVFVGYFTLVITIRGLWDITLGSDILALYLHGSLVDLRSLMTRVFFYSSLGLLSFYLGYYSNLARKLGTPVVVRRWSFVPSRTNLAILISASVGVASYIFLLSALGGVWSIVANPFQKLTETMRGNVFLTPGLAFLSASFLLTYVSTIRKRTLHHWALLLLLYGAMAFFSGILSIKGGIIFPIFLLFICRQYLRRRSSVKPFLALPAAYLLMRPAVDAYRAYGIDLSSIWYSYREGSANLMDFAWNTLSRFHEADSFALIIDRVHSVRDLKWGSTLTQIIWMWIPRALWPSKPETFSVRFGVEYMNELYGRYGITPSPSSIGELFLNFHVLGVLVGFLLIGVSFRVAYMYLIKVRQDPPAIMIYAVLCVTIFSSVEMPIAAAILYGISSLVPTYIVIRFNSRIGIAERVIESLQKPSLAAAP